MNTSDIVRKRIDAAPAGSFLRATDIGGVPRSAVDVALSRAVKSRKDLVRVARGTYWKGKPTRFGPGRPDPVDVARLKARRGVGPTGWLAANQLGLSTQVPAKPKLVTVGRPPRGVPGITFSQRSNVDRVDLSYFDIALLEVLRAYPRYVDVDWKALVKGVRDLQKQGKVNVDKIADVAANERVAALKRNLERLQATLAAP